MNATVKIHDVSSPSEQIMAKAVQSVTVKDATGRVFTLRKPGFLAQFDLVEVAGSAADISRYFQMIFPIIYISAIDGEAIAQPSTKPALRALIQRIGEEAFNVITKAINDNFMPKDVEETKKNSDL